MRDLLSVCNLAVEMGAQLGADEVEAFAVSSVSRTVALERNDVKIGKSQTLSGIGIRVFVNGGLGFASVNDLSKDEVGEAAKRAVSLAKQAPSDPYNQLPERKELKRVDGLYDPSSEEFETADALELATRMLRAAKDYDTRVTVDSGMFIADVGEAAVANSNGVEASEKSSSYICYILGMAIDGGDVSNFDFQFDGSHFLRDLDVEAVAEKLAERVIRSLGAKKTESFKGVAILSPIAVYDLIIPVVISAVNSNNVQKGTSRWERKLDELVASEIVTIIDDGTKERQLGSSMFDREGMPHRPVKIVERGLLRSYLYNTYTAGKEGKDSTGHASGDIGGPPGIGTTNIEVLPGSKPHEDLISEVDRGIYVTRLSAFPDPVTGDFSGLVKGGFLIEKGDLVHPVSETMLAGNVFDLLLQTTNVSKDRERIMCTLLPHFEADGLSITGE